ncbi:MAG TPA: FlgD immunoglobulin-like domain containing protein [Candidatus Krumholzibacteria bacterium]|nr:FlgD immunoglobulin-like domain containing protein [Candidatus Krumholzibacteria bacterium]
MKSLMKTALACVVIAALVPSVHAQPGGDVGIYFDEEGTVRGRNVVPGVQFDVYVVADQIVGGLKAYELSVSGVEEAGLFQLGFSLYGPAPLNIGDAQAQNFIVGTGACMPETTATLVTLTLLAVQDVPDDSRLCVGPANPTSFDPPGPGYSDCNNQIGTFTLVGDGCAVLDPTQPPDYEVELSLDTVNAQIGGTVSMPVGVSQIPVAKSDPSQLAGIDLELHWDPVFAALEDVRVTGTTHDWLVEFNAGSGTADISAASTSPVSIPVDVEEPVLELDFRGGNVEGFTDVTITSSRLFDIGQGAIPHVTDGGRIFVGCDKGDPVEDDEINSADAIRTLLIALGSYDPTPLQFCASDMDSDNTVDVGDAVLVLQTAVGLLTPDRQRGQEPDLFLRGGSEPGEVFLQYSAAAGADMLFAYDPERVAFESATVVEGNGLVASNDEKSGVLRLGFASARAGHGTVRLQFDVAEFGETMAVKYAAAYDEFADRHLVPLDDHEFVFGVTGVDDVPGLGRGIDFVGGRPNPFNPATELRFELAAPGAVQVSIFDAAGRRVRTIDVDPLPAGEHGVRWDGTDDQGRVAASGVYQVLVESSVGADRGRVIMLK